MTILVTGGTGTLGRPTVERLRAAGHDVRILSRTPGPDRVVGDVTTGAGLAEAMRGVDTVLHLATSAGKKDPRQTQNVVDAARAAGVTHLVYISIVGVDVNPYPYYRAKLESEQIIERSGIPFTILRATQFHDFIAMFLRLQRRLPFIALARRARPADRRRGGRRPTRRTGGCRRRPAWSPTSAAPSSCRCAQLIDTWQRARRHAEAGVDAARSSARPSARSRRATT